MRPNESAWSFVRAGSSSQPQAAHFLRCGRVVVRDHGLSHAQQVVVGPFASGAAASTAVVLPLPPHRPPCATATASPSPPVVASVCVCGLQRVRCALKLAHMHPLPLPVVSWAAPSCSRARASTPPMRHCHCLAISACCYVCVCGLQRVRCAFILAHMVFLFPVSRRGQDTALNPFTSHGPGSQPAGLPRTVSS